MRSLILILLLFSISCTVEKKMDKETTKEALKELIQDSIDSSVVRRHRLTNSDQKISVQQVKCNYFLSSVIVKCQFDITNESDKPIKNLEVWFVTQDAKMNKSEEFFAMTETKEIIKPGESELVSITTSEIGENAKNIQFYFKTKIKKHDSNLDLFAVEDIVRN